LFKAGVEHYDVLVTDVHLSGRLSGWDVARAMREINPVFPVVYITGAAADEWISEAVPNSVLVQKPFRLRQIVTAISQLLEAAKPTAPTSE